MARTVGMGQDGNLAASIVVTGCDANHLHLALECLQSLRDITDRPFAVGFAHIGAGRLPEIVFSLADMVASVDDEGVELGPAEGFKMAYLSVKARLPALFPGFETYLWLDADTWVARAEGLHEIAGCARSADLAIHPQIDPNYYACQYPDNYTLSVYRRIFGEADMRRFSRWPMINGGVFGAARASPLWRLWQESLDAIRDRIAGQKDRFFSDQIPLHRLIVEGRLRICPLRAVNNWLVLHALPRFDPATGLLTAPSPPFEPINIVHLVGAAKASGISVAGKDVPLHYSQFSRLRREDGRR